MTLPMTRPWRHPDTGIYWLRKAVPRNLRAIVGKREVKKSLGTKDAKEAKVLLSQALAELEVQWANLRKGATTISEREAHEIGKEFHDNFISRHIENPSQHRWIRSAFARLDDIANFDKSAGDPKRPNPFQHRCYDLCQEAVSAYIAKKGLVIDEQSRKNLIRDAARAFERASYTLDRYALGNFPDDATPKSPDTSAPIQVRIPSRQKVSFEEVVQGWSKERNPPPKTIYSWRGVLSKLSDFLGHDDAVSVTTKDLIGWKDSMVGEGLSTKTIRDSKLAPIRAIFQWGVDNRRINENPAIHVKIESRKKAGEGKRGFTDDEARLILEAAAKADDLALRWMPNICAYSGARISEVAQLRKQDVTKVEEIWCIRIDPEAGHLKNKGSERVIPIHSALIDMGFLQFVASIPAGPLFANVEPDRFENRGGNATKKISDWVRGLGLTDKRLPPSHGWRHRLKSQSRQHDLALDQVNAIMGYSSRNVADGYGEFPISGLKREIEKIPKILLQEKLKRRTTSQDHRRSKRSDHAAKSGLQKS